MTLKKDFREICSERGEHLAEGEKRSGVIWAKNKTILLKCVLKKGERKKKIKKNN